MKLCFRPIAGKAEDIISAILEEPMVTECKKETYAIHLALEELIINVVSYAYKEGEDDYLKVEIEREGDMLSITLRDGGVAFNPLEKETPDTSLALEDRQIGGLGIFLTLQMMDSVEYQREGNENVLTIKKRISNEE